MIHHLRQEYPASVVCDLLGCPRSSFYYQPTVNPEEAEVLAAIERVLMRWPFYGYRRVTAQLKREGHVVGETRVRRRLRQLDHSCSVGRVRVVTTDSDHDLPRHPNRIKHLEVTRPNQVWVADITYIRLELEFVYLAVILDAYSRRAIGWALDRTLEDDLSLATLRMALRQRRPAPGLVHHSDRGTQYASQVCTDRLREQQIEISMSRQGNPLGQCRLRKRTSSEHSG